MLEGEKESGSTSLAQLDLLTPEKGITPSILSNNDAFQVNNLIDTLRVRSSCSFNSLFKTHHSFTGLYLSGGCVNKAGDVSREGFRVDPDFD